MEDERPGNSTRAPFPDGEPGAARKRYERPELVTFGSVRDLTRTGTKGGLDVNTRRN